MKAENDFQEYKNPCPKCKILLSKLELNLKTL